MNQLMNASEPASAKIKEQFDVVCLGRSYWYFGLWTNRQHVMSRMAREHRVLYIEPPSSIQQLINPSSGLRRRDWFAGIRGIAPNLYVYTPKRLPYGRLSPIGAVNRLLVRWQLRIASQRLGLECPVLWVTSPDFAFCLGALQESLVVYHCTDSNEGYEIALGQKGVNRTRRLEELLVQKADVIFTTSLPLFEYCRQVNPNTIYAPNVGDVDHFGKAMLDETIVPADISRISHPIIGFVGAVDDYKIDFALVSAMAKARPSWSIVIIGPIGAADRTSRESLPRADNIHYLGQKEYQYLPGYIKAFDVCIIPYRLNAYTEAVFPIKFHEYMASGKPIVSTWLPSLVEYEQVVPLCKDVNQFLEAIQNALTADSPEQMSQRLQLARQNSWDVRVLQFQTAIRQMLSSDRSRSVSTPFAHLSDAGN